MAIGGQLFLFVCVLSVGEPDGPVLLSDEIKVEGNSISVPIKQIDDGGSPLLHFRVQYKQVRNEISQLLCHVFSVSSLSLSMPPLFNQDKEKSEWKEMQLAPYVNSVFLRDLIFGSDYHLEIRAVNANGSSIPATFNFTIAEEPGMSLLLPSPHLFKPQMSNSRPAPTAFYVACESLKQDDS